MSAKFFYLYLILSLAFVGIFIWDLIKQNQEYYMIAFHGIFALWLGYRAFRIYKTKKDQELM